MKKSCYLVALAAMLSGCSTQAEEPTVLTISAAASLSDVLQDAAEVFRQQQDIQLQFNFGSSGSLKEQIEQGAPVDVFISASTDKFEELEQKQLVKNGEILVRNELVLITSTEGPTDVQSFSDLTRDEVEKIALGTVETVPAGTYGKQVLVYYDLWSTLEEKIVYAKDVRQALTYVETNNAQAGLVYKTDVLSSENVRIVQVVDAASHDEIVYPAGVVAATADEASAQLFLDFLASAEMAPLWEQYGFVK
ncbi:MAG: molybdate ABC transporter substrate-binding protein [Solibacillus sp.]